ncbi:Non-specific serine/threonine protein kinase [Sulfidibacter corallicola]|uniref:Protein kinase n=1 Tax=Sulfidibacter corallicola TaxID=2818388 RepID=A0A8A4TUZ4_SULCO|nr:protein kinase [Sulfidibacter corallicola]QTD52941.1 protein kinase [Sulfidibacter corallicola]
MGNWAKQARLAMSNRDYTQAGDFFKMDGNHRAAIKAYLKAQNFVEAAKLQEQLGKVKKAQKLLEKNGKPQDLADFYIRQGDTEQAIDIFRQSGMLFEAAEMLEKINDLTGAAGIYEQLGFHEKAGVIYGKIKNLDKAISMFAKVIHKLEREEGPNSRARILKFRSWIANMHVGAKRFNQAGEIFREINQPDKAAKCFVKGGNPIKAAEIHLAMNQFEEATNLLRGVQSPESRTLLGKISFEQGQYREAVTLLKGSEEHELIIKANELLGNYKEAAYHREKIGDLKGAADMYAKAMDFQKAAILYEQTHSYREAASCFERLKKYANAAKLYHHAKHRYKAGECLYKINRLDDALQQLQMLDPEDENFPEARKIMSEIFFKQGDYSVARKLLEDVVSKAVMDDNNMPYFYLLGRCLEEEHDYDSAKRYFERIMARRVGFADVRTRLKRLSKLAPRNESSFSTSRSMFSPNDLTVGEIIAERFKIVQTIGKGGMGSIFKVRDLSLDRVIALKVLLADRGNFEELKAELITARDLTHPYIIKVFDIGEWNNIGYFTMEYVDGQSLKTYILNSPNDNIEKKIQLLIRICEGLKAAHDQGVVHRDIKPQNILITEDFIPKILDFGIARKVTQTRKEKNISGSPKYMAPEQIQNTMTDERTDIYAMGVIMFYMFTLREPFLARTAQEIMLKQLEEPLPEPMSLNPKIPYWLCEIIKKCCMKSINMRFNNMGELIEELQANVF